MEVSVTPIGYMQSVFRYKNGTPRQSMLCADAKGVLKIDKSIFNNPEHSLENLETFSHVWILFLFHKNTGCATKAKVRPPRLEGRRVGVFSTRSPHRPNPIGLTLAKLDSVQGDRLYVSGIDIIDGTPVLDVKPYIQEYDAPHSRLRGRAETGEVINTECNGSPTRAAKTSAEEDSKGDDSNCIETVVVNSKRLDQERLVLDTSLHAAKVDSKINPTAEGSEKHLLNLKPSVTQSCLCADVQVPTGCLVSSPSNSPTSETEVCRSQPSAASISTNLSPVHITDFPSPTRHNTSREVRMTSDRLGNMSTSSPDSNTVSSSWIPEVDARLSVRFTDRAEHQLKQFSRLSDNPKHRLSLLGNSEEVRRAIVSVLVEDPRSVYRRHKCKDSLYFCTVDCVHVTCWFDQGVAEVVRLQPLDDVSELLKDTGT